ncbi:helix-turn-helix domain-containing protein [Rhizobium leguminosarum]|uniref:helix-turn-helix domain-containing protein n=1 Tax=Rhizobium leguminosarum TaxID=384 RepID=UPI00102F3402|nr:helix-turn-helix domain-containing protein [Rhizobium leguminosarum]TBE54451.1 helix-turn-helix domain-containing protein [Rhizobium leguminosarum]
MSSPRFSIIPAWIVTDGRMKGSDLKVLCLLGTYTNKEGWCRRSQVKMAEQLNCGRSTVQDSLNRLAEIGAVEKQKVASADGRDSAHWYRVVLDRAPISDAFGAWEAEDQQEFGPISGDKSGTPPAGRPAPPAGPRPAPPAGPRPAPPAGSGPAPINDSNLTPPVERSEREPGLGGEEEENPRALERRFRRWWATWPTYAVDTETTARRAWLDLTPEQRKACEERTADYLATVKASGRKFSKAAATYLSERAWERLGEKDMQHSGQAPEPYTAYSRAGRGLLLAELLRPMRQLQLNKVEENIIETSPEKGGMIWRDKREKQGWPEAVKLIETTVQRRRFHVPQRVVELSKDFDKVKVGSDIWEAWQRLHFRRCWPWLPAPDGLEWMQFPRIVAHGESEADLDDAVERGLEEFAGRLNEGRGDDDAV